MSISKPIKSSLFEYQNQPEINSNKNNGSSNDRHSHTNHKNLDNVQIHDANVKYL